jgi:signal transduction histidine kinase
VVDYPPLSSKLREIRIDIEKTPGALARCLERGKSETVDFDEADPLRETIRGLTEPDDLRHAFACAPLIGKQKKPIGVLVVDNRFLLKERKIDDEEIAGLEAFAGLLALSIENVRLQERLAEQQRVENWKEVTGSIAHSVGTLLFEAKGDVRNLRGHLCAPTNITSEEKLGALFDELNNGISRAEKVLFEFRSYANPTPLELEQLDLRRILRNVFQPVHGGCPIEMSLPSPLPVLADASKLGNSLREIRKNALEAMAGIADRPALIEVKVRVDEDTLTKRFVRIEITDNGDGIKDSVIRDVFKPGKTTKADGTGLGLPMVKSVIEAHGGTIEADNGPDGGARFTVCIPMMIVTEEERTQRSG